MSYILDALKRAESERGRGAVPNIHAQTDLRGGPDARGVVARWLGLGLIAMAIAVSAAGAWWWLSGDERATWNPADAVGEVQVPALSTPPFNQPAEPTEPAMPKPAATLVAVPTVPPARKPAAAAPANAGALPAARPIAQAGAVAAASASAVGPSPVAEERVYSVKELPDDIRNSLPALAVGGATYSENPANRMLIVNGGLFHEGDKLAPEVTLQQIKLRTAVLSYRGYRYTINY